MTQPGRQPPSSYLDQSSGANLRAQVEAMRNRVYQEMVAPNRTQVWDGDQLALQRRINELAEETNAGVVPEAISSPDDFEQLSLEQIRDLTREMKPDVVLAASEAWEKTGTEWTDAARELGDGVRTALVGRWEGQAAGKAMAAMGKFVDASVKAGQSATMVGLKIGFAQRASDEARRMMEPLFPESEPTGLIVKPFPDAPTLAPAPVPGAAAPLFPPMDAEMRAEYEREEAHAACLQVLRNVYAPGIHGGDQDVPALPLVNPIAGGSAPTTPQLSGGGIAGLPESGSEAAAAGAANPHAADGQSAGNQTAGSANPFAQPASTSPTGLHQPGEPGSGEAPATTAAGMNPGEGAPGSAGHVGGRPGGLGGPGRTSRPGPGGGAPSGSPSSTILAGAGGAAERAGASGSAGMSPGMMPPGSKPAEEKEHKSPDYLRGQHLQEWFEPREPLVFEDGVIGVDPKPTPPEQSARQMPRLGERLPGDHR